MIEATFRARELAPSPTSGSAGFLDVQQHTELKGALPALLLCSHLPGILDFKYFDILHPKLCSWSWPSTFGEFPPPKPLWFLFCFILLGQGLTT
jgi:hypothetical protein